MEDKKQLVPAQAPGESPDMVRTALLPLNKIYMEDDKRKMNFVVKNSIENVFAGLTDLQRFVKVVDPEYDVSVYGGTPGQVGFTVQYFKKQLHVHGGHGDHGHVRSHTTTFKGTSKIEEMTHPNSIKMSSKMEIDGVLQNVSVTTTYLTDRGDGTVLVMMAADEKAPSFWQQMAPVFCIMPCALLCIPCIKSFYDSQVQALGYRVLVEYQKYLSISSVETISFYQNATPVAAAVVVQSAPSSGNELVQQLENLKKLHDQGVLSAEQYEAAKNKVIQG